MRGYFVRTKDGFVGMIKDTLGYKEYKDDKVVKESTKVYLYDDINGENIFDINDVEVLENLYTFKG